MESLSLAQARKVTLLSQGLHAQQLTGTPYQRTVKAMTALGYVQIDTISVVQRAHHHTLWNRNPDYQTDHLDKMVKEKQVYEYWSHAASYLAMKDFRFSLPRKLALKSGQQQHWFRKDLKLMASVLERIKDEGPLMAKDFASDVTKKTGWETKPSKQALETLYMQGDLMITERKNFHKVYDITERVLPDHVDTTQPTPEEHAKFLVQRYLAEHGIGQLNEMVYLLKGVKAHVKTALNEMGEQGLIEQVEVNGEFYFTSANSLALLNKQLKRKQVNILSPFDNLVIQRAKTKRLFNFDYLLECYTPAVKRKFGYFCLPILWDGTLVGMIDCKTHKARSHLEVINIFIDPLLKNIDEFRAEFDLELVKFAAFNQVETVSNYHIRPLR
ncbi:winged helix-turn-helix domain-containing protein [Vibrio sp. RC27]